MQRFRDLVHTRRSWLVVTPAAKTAAPPITTGRVPQNGAAGSRGGSKGSDTAVNIINMNNKFKEYRHQFTSLADAVAASRPGNTILLEAGIHKASNVVISHPLQIIGDGSDPNECILGSFSSNGSNISNTMSTSSASLTAPVLIFDATAGKFSNISIESGIGGCVVHYKGRLAIEDCALRCDARGLDHLAAPLISSACSKSENNGISAVEKNTTTEYSHYQDTAIVGSGDSSIQSPMPSVKAATAPPVVLLPEEESDTEGEDDEKAVAGNLEKLGKEKMHKENEREEQQLLPNLSSSLYCNDSCCTAPGPGVVSVIGCSMEGGSTAVKVTGTGAVQSVRVIYESHKALFYFDVDSKNNNPGETTHQEEQKRRGEDEKKLLLSGNNNKNISIESDGVGDVCCMSKAAMPSWVENKVGVGFDPGALQAQIAAAVVAVKK